MTWEGGALGGVGGRKDHRPAGNTSLVVAHNLLDQQVGQQQQAVSLGVADHLLDSHLGGGGTIPGLKSGDLGCALWVGRDRHPVCQLSTGHPSFRREPWKIINFSKEGLGVKWRKELASQVLSGKVKVVVLCSFSSFVNIHFGFIARWG